MESYCTKMEKKVTILAIYIENCHCKNRIFHIIHYHQNKTRGEMKEKAQNYIEKKILEALDIALDKDRKVVSCWVLYQPDIPSNLDKYYEVKCSHDKKNIFKDSEK